MIQIFQRDKRKADSEWLSLININQLDYVMNEDMKDAQIETVGCLIN